MRAIPPGRSILHYWAELTYLEAALLAEEETAPFAAPVTTMLEEFDAITKRDLDTRRAIIQAYARSSVADTNLDEALREVQANTLHLVRQDRSRKEYKTLFPAALTGLIRHALARQVVVAHEFVERLGLSLFDAEFRKAQVTLLDPQIARGEAVLVERKEAELGRVEARIEIETWKEEVNAVRMSVYAQLLTIAAKHKRKRAWAETFFPKNSNRGARGADEAEDDNDESEPGAE
ncbi:MAG: hypothetical protein R6X02_10465 [Enhygromyxa sp.]